jgi:hypothetical protein
VQRQAADRGVVHRAKIGCAERTVIGPPGRMFRRSGALTCDAPYSFRRPEWYRQPTAPSPTR